MKTGLSEELIAMRVAKEFFDGAVVNLGYGLPVLAANHVPQDKTIIFHTENGALGIGPIVCSPPFDWDVVNASGQPVSRLPGLSFFDHAFSFNMIRGKHIDITVLGALQVSERGDLANWTAGKRMATGPGGAVDLAIGAKMVIIAMQHTTKDGKPKIVKQCTYPLTGKGVVNTIITDIAVIEMTPQGLQLSETAPGFTAEDVQAVTEPRLRVTSGVREMEF